MYWTHNEGNPVVAERFRRTLRGKINKIMTANDNKSYLGCLNKLVDDYKNSYHRSIGKEPIHADYSALPEELESSFKASKFIVDDRVRITKYKNIFTKDYTEKWSKELFVIDSVLKTIPGRIKLKI